MQDPLGTGSRSASSSPLSTVCTPTPPSIAPDHHSTTFRLLTTDGNPQQLQMSQLQPNWNDYESRRRWQPATMWWCVLRTHRCTSAVGDPFIIGLQWIQCSDYCTGAEDQTDDEKGVNSARYVRSDSPSSRVRIATPSKTTCLGGHAARTSRASDKPVPIVNDDPKEKISSLSLEDGVEKIVTARNSVLAALPLPFDIPEEELQPILPPHSYSLGDFNTTGVRVIFQRTRSTYRHVKTLKDSRSSFPSRSL
ncbi:hypothetical protein PISMIDRAFT_10274 [Pisolithus microcarpus 441]|uniref:Uncharacterized protein n=1 Tax=Pisolithus microcarpus 441 TaxID=765257 RepID=A0A0C9ZXT2_9AGAM|nr:hypothetical protein PISMIDRAFT_10274 [Pisolithus microcarpus 441]